MPNLSLKECAEPVPVAKFTKDVVEGRVEAYTKRYVTGKDLWSGKCLTCDESECDCYEKSDPKFEREEQEPND